MVSPFLHAVPNQITPKNSAERSLFMKTDGLFFVGNHYSSSDFAVCMICWAVLFKTSNMGESKFSQ